MISARPPKAPTGRPSANHFAQRGEIGRDAAQLLVSAAGEAKARHDFVKNQHNAVLRALLAEHFEKAFPRKVKSSVRRDWFPMTAAMRLPRAIKSESSAWGSLNGRVMVRSANACGTPRYPAGHA